MSDTYFLRERQDHEGIVESAPEKPEAKGYVGTFVDAPRPNPDGLIVESDNDGNVVVRTNGVVPGSLSVVRDADGNVVVTGNP